MKVEIYLDEENKTLISENQELQEWKKKVEELGLNGQKELFRGNKSPIPFRAMNLQEIRVYETLLPSKVAVEKYDKSVIPLRVLAVIALAKQEQYFDYIEVWYDDNSPDPAVVGIVKEPDVERYLIARWGEELLDYPSLLKLAIKRWAEKKTVEYKKQIAKYENYLSNIETYANDYFINLSPEYYFY